MRIAFYAPLKAPDHPTASGDRLIAGLFVRALEHAGHEVVTASRLRAFDGAGDRGLQLRVARTARVQARGLLDRWRGSPRAPECWFTYHLYHKAPDWIGPRVSARLGIPYVAAEASHAPGQARGAWRHGHRAVTVALSRAGRIVALNPDDVPGIERHLGAGAPIVRLPPFLDTRAFAPLGRRSRRRARIVRLVGADPSVPLVACAAMMRPGRKAESFKLLARALERVTHLPWRLLVVGGGRARGEVEAAFAELAAAGRIVFLGPRSPRVLRGVVRACDLFVWPALGEPLGMAMLEAQALGVPVIDRRLAEMDRGEREGRTRASVALAVVGLDDVVEILHLPVPRLLPRALALGLQLGDGGGAGWRLVGIQHLRLFPILETFQGLAEESLRRLGVTGR